MRSGTAENNFRYGRWKSFYALLFDGTANKIVGAEAPVPIGESYPIENTSEGYRRIYPINSRGEERVWRSSFETGRKRCEDGEIIVTPGGSIQQAIDHENKREVLFSNWTDTKFNAGSYGSQLLTDMGLGKNFDYPKSIYTMETALWLQTFADPNSYIMDYFGGSGTTAHGVINLNRFDNGNRKFILVEMGAYFDSATKPRVLKALYSKDWKDGKPVSREGISHCFKYMRLESYEDTLNNLVVKQTEGQLGVIENNPSFREGYMLNYMLDVETRDSLLNLEWFENPFNCYLNVTKNNELVPTKVDLVETFNYLIGLVVENYAVPKEGYVVVTGKNLAGDSILVVWRDCTQHNGSELNKFLEKSKYNPLDTEYDRIYVNGDNNVENLKTGDERWKVVLIEEEFGKRMFEQN
jgi:adenine-specific DNA-methyltransferase